MLTLIASVTVNPNDENPKYYIGDGDNLVVRLSQDLLQFKDYTMGKKMVMGYNTFRTVGALPGRQIYVPTHRKIETTKDNVCFVDNIDFVALSEMNEEIIIAGGSSIYEQALPYANKLRLTVVSLYPYDGYIGDKLFPDFKKFGPWKVQAVGPAYQPVVTNGLPIKEFQVYEYT